ncbi:LPXTG cell wall anchor domain-containing protein, partial [Listeria innocua]|nr:LPXTG cell wall anchor domain-containing protein [Listeria innocua]EIX3331238.1 LPXTG cell wall anchor domain-containing protein [Listeria innocua]EIX6956560.1 LPXTG cell wall anchor domain-containing protein [Listeria innocua]EKF1883502.1 LPXTG cell wall anchor domain-containing protein [Listeria innocua]EKK9091682.1 LPXTG cell wall anchor domain-containing protein [Listeria innocua]
PVDPVDPVDPVTPVNPSNQVNSIDPVKQVIQATETLLKQTTAVNPIVAKDNRNLPKTGDSGMTSSLFSGLILAVSSVILLRKRK